MFVSDIESTVMNSKIKSLVPYECEFIIVDTKESMYKLIEIYNLTNNTFVLQYGEWDFIEGLKSSNLSLYWRRLNINGIVFKTVSTHPGDVSFTFCV